MNKIFFQFLLFLSFSSFAQDEIVVKMDRVVNDSLILIGEDYLFFQTLEMYGSLNEDILSTYKNIPKNDSIMILGHIEDPVQMLFDLWKDKKYDKSKMLEYFSNWRVDTLNLSRKKINQELIIAVGFKGDKQFIIADLDRNKDFKNDEIIWYDINFRNNNFYDKSIISKSTMLNFKYEVFRKGKIYEFQNDIVLYPSKIGAPIGNGKYDIEYAVKLTFKDYFKGKVQLNNAWISFYLKNQTLFVKPEGKYFSATEEVFNSQFIKSFRDLVVVNGKSFQVVKVEPDYSALYIVEVMD